MFGDYSIEQAAKILHSSEDVVRRVIEQGKFPVYRQFWLFGAWRIKAEFIDSIAPEVAAHNQRFHALYGTPEENKRKREEHQKEIEETKARTERIQQEGLDQQKQFWEKLNAITTEYQMKRLNNDEIK